MQLTDKESLARMAAKVLTLRRLTRANALKKRRLKEAREEAKGRGKKTNGNTSGVLNRGVSIGGGVERLKGNLLLGLESTDGILGELGGADLEWTKEDVRRVQFRRWQRRFNEDDALGIPKMKRTLRMRRNWGLK